jgi:hypothetical protein
VAAGTGYLGVAEWEWPVGELGLGEWDLLGWAARELLIRWAACLCRVIRAVTGTRDTNPSFPDIFRVFRVATRWSNRANRVRVFSGRARVIRVRFSGIGFYAQIEFWLAPLVGNGY